jgi:hypothetical protein
MHWYEKNIMGSGPFKLTEYQVGQSIKGERNPITIIQASPTLMALWRSSRPNNRCVRTPVLSRLGRAGTGAGVGTDAAGSAEEFATQRSLDRDFSGPGDRAVRSGN